MSSSFVSEVSSLSDIEDAQCLSICICPSDSECLFLLLTLYPALFKVIIKWFFPFLFVLYWIVLQEVNSPVWITSTSSYEVHLFYTVYSFIVKVLKEQLWEQMVRRSRWETPAEKSRTQGSGETRPSGPQQNNRVDVYLETPVMNAGRSQTKTASTVCVSVCSHAAGIQPNRSSL